MQTSYVTKFENYLDRFLPPAGQKCALFDCVPGWLWLIGAGITVVASASLGWAAVLKTVLWQAVVGFGVAWLCRGCHTRWLWFLLILGIVMPIVVVVGAMVMIGKAECKTCA